MLVHTLEEQMKVEHDERRAPFLLAPGVEIDKRHAGRTHAAETPVELRCAGHSLGDGLRTWILESMGRKLGKYAEQIERSVVRLGDENGSKGGIDKTCLIQLSLSALPNIVVEEHGETELEAFNRAVACAERAARHEMQRHGFSNRRNVRNHHSQAANGHGFASAEQVSFSVDDDMAGPALGAGEPDSLIGKRVGRGPQNLSDTAARPEKERRDQPVDTALPNVSATDRRAGYGHTARRNSKLNTAGMTYELEDSLNGQPSRKSTRGSAKHVKPDAPLTTRTKSALHAPSARAARAKSGT
jgi:putative sigma-54 modulation protein